MAPRSVDETADLTTVDTSQPVKKDTFCSHTGDLERRLLQLNQNEKCKSLLNPTVEPLVQVFTKYFPKFVSSSKPPETVKTNISELKPTVTPLAADCKLLPMFGPNESVQIITTIDISEFKPALAIGHKKLPQKSNKPGKPSAETNKRTGEITSRKGPITSEDINRDLLLRLAEEDTTSQVRKRQPVIQRSEVSEQKYL